MCICEITLLWRFLGQLSQLSTASLRPVHGLCQTFSVDFTGPLFIICNVSRFCPIVVRYFTGWPKVPAVRPKTSDVATKYFQGEIYRQFEGQATILTDNKPAFSSTAWKRCLNVHRRAQKMSPARVSSPPEGPSKCCAQ